MLLVTGATGTTGMEVLKALKARGAEARALVRDETKAHHLRDLGFEPVTGDLGRPAHARAGAGGRRARLPRLADRADAVGVRAGVPGDRARGGRQARRQALDDRRLARGAAALRPHPRQGGDGAEGDRHDVDAAAPDGLHAEHARLGLAGARRDLLLARPGRVVQHRRRPRRGRGRRRRADRGRPREQGLRALRPRGRLLPRPGQARVRRRRARDRASRRSRSRRSSASSCAPASRRGTPRA